jgi:hypothetical protein
MKTTLRWSALLAAIIITAAGGLFLSTAVAKQRRVSNAPVAPYRTATTVATSSFTFSTPIELTKTPISPIFFQQDGEPEIKVDVFGNIYVTAINGVPGGTDLWKSTDKGTSFVYLGEPDGAQDHCSTLLQCAGLGGGDDSTDISPGGYLYVSSLWIGNVTVSTSKDGGTGGTTTDQAWQVNPAAAAVVSDDRMWLAAYGPQTLNMTYRQAPGTGDLFFVKSTDAGKTFGAPVLVRSGNSTEGNLVVDPFNGNLYTTTIPSTATNQIHLLKSIDGGATWTETTAYSAPVGADPAHKFTILAVDRGGNVHLVFSQRNLDGSYHIYLMSSADQGVTWLAPVQVDSGTGNSTFGVMPWVVAGSPGVVDITWLGSTTSPATFPSAWYVFFAQTTNALSTTPTFNQVQVLSKSIHDQDICFNGSGCAGNPRTSPGNRDLLEYFTVTIDPDGNANIAYPDSLTPDCPSNACQTNTWYAKQTAGTSAYAPPAGPAVATFTMNLPVGSPGGEPGIKVDSHNCIFTTTPGNPWLWKSVNNGLSFLPPVNPVANNVNAGGGDEDILPVLKPGGVRPDDLYFADLALDDVNIEKSIDGGTNWFEPGPGGAGGIVSVSVDRQWLAFDHAPTAADQTIYLMDHELSTEAIRFSANTNPDTGAWSPPTSGMTDPELILPPSSTFPNTNPGPVFTDPRSHMVYGVFNASTVNTNRANPPFGKMPNVWEAVGPAPAAAGAPPGPMVNHPVFKGVFDSPTTAPTPPPGTTTYGTNCSNDFPSATIDSTGNIYAVWAMNNARTNEYMIWFASSHDHGASFYGPFQISQGPGAAEMPWIAAGDNGRVDIVYYGTNATNPDGTSVDPNIAPASTHWNTFMAQSLNANAREPAFTISQVSDHVMHNGSICNLGLLCILNGGDRSLADFFQVAIGPDGLANISFADNGHSSTHVEFARQLTGPLGLTSPTSPTCIPLIFPVSAVSRKVHGAAGTFDLNLPLSGNPGIECRTGGASGNHQIVITFANAVSVGGATVSSGTGTVSNFSASGAVVTVNLTGVTNAQRIVLDLTNVNDGTNIGDAFVGMNVLAGDTTANGAVNSSDIAQTQSQSGQVVTSSNFRQDVTVNGLVNSSDIAFVQSKSGTALP